MKEKIITEIQRVAKKLNKPTITRKEFNANPNLKWRMAVNYFASWTNALREAGLKPGERMPPQNTELSEDDLMKEIISLTKEIGKIPSDRDMQALGRFSPRPYIKRWGTFTKARDFAYVKLGFPEVDGNLTGPHSKKLPVPVESQQAIKTHTFIPESKVGRKKVQFGEPIDFRGLRFAPINEQGVVYLFGMISRELGFLIESIRTDFPDCEGKRCVDVKKNRWEHCLIEFEYKRSNFNEHGHNSAECDLIVCWVHDWKECPIEVLELRSTIQRM